MLPSGLKNELEILNLGKLCQSDFRTLSISTAFCLYLSNMDAGNLCCSEHTHRDRSGFLSLAMMWKQVYVCLREKHTNRCKKVSSLLQCWSCF